VSVKHRVLVVEDNPLNRELLCDWLEVEGYEVHAASTLQEARHLSEEHSPGIVLLDVQLGNEDGLMFAAWMREDERFQSVPVIAVTAHAMLTEQERILQSGCNACVSKPVDFSALREQMRRWLAMPGLSR
jgi:CheY-like chemotaxis protein